ncbi:MAG: leucyl/phenylalanyl-tRNA--protein transferase [Pseudomonadales bacterium]
MAALNLKHRRGPSFPPVDQALEEPNGLLAAGGRLSPDWLLAAYSAGVFPWFNDDAEPILWWSPDPRGVLRPAGLRISRSLVKRLRNAGFRVSFDRAFSEVIRGCAAARTTRSGGAGGTWITARMMAAYEALHEEGFVHSVEVWRNADSTSPVLVGGLYGVSLGRLFFGESMFSRERDASKIALCYLARQLHDWEFPLIDCQLSNPHLLTLGLEEMDRRTFMRFVEDNPLQETRRGKWTLELDRADDWTRSGSDPVLRPPDPAQA